MKRQSGFTLIEMVVVIVILGILAVTAAPRFLNLQSDARASSLQGLKGAMAGANGIVYGKATIEGKEQQENAQVTDGNNKTIATAYGYPKASEKGIVRAVDGLEADWDYAIDKRGKRADRLVATFKSDINGDFKAIEKTECYVKFTEAKDGKLPVVEVIDTKC